MKGCALAALFVLAAHASTAAAQTTYPLAQLHPPPPSASHAAVDSNSPASWDGDDFYLFNSAGNFIKRSMGPALKTRGDPQIPRFNTASIRVNHWIEAVW